MDSKNDNEKVNTPLFLSPEPAVSCIDDLDFFNNFEDEFPAIVYNDALTSKLDFSTEPTLCPQHIDEFNLKDETSLSKYEEVEQNVLYFNDLFPFNIVYPDDLKLDKDNNDNEIVMIQSSGDNENTQGSNKLLEESHDKINKVFIIRSFVMKLNVNIVAWNHFVNGKLFNLIKNLYVPFAIPFDPKRYCKDGDCARRLRRPRYDTSPPHDQRHLWLRYQVNRVHILDFEGLTLDMRHDLAERMRMEFILEFFSTCRIGDEMGLDVASTLCFQLRGARRSITWSKDFLRGSPSYSYIRDPVQRLCDRLISYNIYGKQQAPKKVTTTDLFYPRNMDRGAANVPYLLAQYLFRHAEGRKSDARLLGCHFIRRLAHHFGLVNDDGLRGLSVVARELPLIDMALRLKRQQVATAGALEATEHAPSVDEGAQVDPAPVQAPQPPPPPPTTGRTMP
ncbi:hypothetical protein Tco_0686398 [Tanacetum coccineum]